jgi:hypothetical protein
MLPPFPAITAGLEVLAHTPLSVMLLANAQNLPSPWSIRYARPPSRSG